MEKTRRLLAMCMVLILMINLMPHVVLAGTEPLLETGFEDFKPFTQFRAATGNAIWNGTAPTGWSNYVDAGDGTVIVNDTDAYDGNICVQFTAADDGTAKDRLNVSATFDLANLQVGSTYVVSVWAKKSQGSDLTLRIQFQYKTSGNTVVKKEVTTQWADYTYEFTHVEGRTNPFKLVVGTETGTVGSLYIDKVSVMLKDGTDDLLSNGSFEDGAVAHAPVKSVSGTAAVWNGTAASGWNCAADKGSGYIIVNNSDAYEGSDCLQFTAGGESDRDRISANTTFPISDLVVGNTYATN